MQIQFVLVISWRLITCHTIPRWWVRWWVRRKPPHLHINYIVMLYEQFLKHSLHGMLNLRTSSGTPFIQCHLGVRLIHIICNIVSFPKSSLQIHSYRNVEWNWWHLTTCKLLFQVMSIRNNQFASKPTHIYWVIKLKIKKDFRTFNKISRFGFSWTIDVSGFLQ